MNKLFIALPLLAASLAFGADQMTKYDAKPGSKVTLDGTSSVHDWTVESTIIGGSMELGFDPANPKNSSVAVNIDARGLWTGEPDPRDCRIRRLSVAPLLGEAVKRIADESSVSSLFD